MLWSWTSQLGRSMPPGLTDNVGEVRNQTEVQACMEVDECMCNEKECIGASPRRPFRTFHLKVSEFVFASECVPSRIANF